MAEFRPGRTETFWVILAGASIVLVILGVGNAVFAGGNWLTPVGPAFTAAASIMFLLSLRRARRKRDELNQHRRD